MSGYIKICLILRTLLPSDDFVRSSDMDTLARAVLMNSALADVFVSVLDALPDVPDTLAEAFAQYPVHSIDQYVANGLMIDQGLFSHILEIYEEIARHPAIFERMFSRRLTDGNEQCPDWESYDRPVVARI